MFIITEIIQVIGISEKYYKSNNFLNKIKWWQNIRKLKVTSHVLEDADFIWALPPGMRTEKSTCVETVSSMSFVLTLATTLGD